MLSPQSPTAGVSSPVSLATPDPLARPARDPLAAPAAEQPRVDAASELPTPTSAEEDLRRDAELYTPRDEPASPSSRSSVVRFTVGGKTLGAERERLHLARLDSEARVNAVFAQAPALLGPNAGLLARSSPLRRATPRGGLRARDKG